MKADSKSSTVTRILGLALAVHVCLSHRLWAGDRLFPHIPCFEFLSLPSVVEYVVATSIVLLSVGLAVKPQVRLIAVSLAIILPSYCLFDQMRMQTWLYFFWLLILPLCSHHQQSERILSLQRIVIAGLYFWSGIQKLNPEYWYYVHAFVFKPLEGILPGTLFELLVQCGYLAGPLEAGLGLGLLFVRVRTYACWGLCAMHALIVICLGAQQWNVIVWPWNLAMAMLVLNAFYRSTWQIELRGYSSPAYVVIGLVWLAPVLNLFAAWDHNLSFSLYSGRSSGLVLYFKEEITGQLDAELQPLLSEFVDADGYRTLPVDTWSLSELQVPVTPEHRVYVAIANHICKWDLGTDQHSVIFAIYRRSGRGDKEVFVCE